MLIAIFNFAIIIGIVAGLVVLAHVFAPLFEKLEKRADRIRLEHVAANKKAMEADPDLQDRINAERERTQWADSRDEHQIKKDQRLIKEGRFNEWNDQYDW